MSRKKEEAKIEIDWVKLIALSIGLLVGSILTIKLVGSF